MNKLYFGDNLDMLREKIKDESVDLVYLDPPFKSNANYNVLFKPGGVVSEAQAEAFRDTWEWGASARLSLSSIDHPERPGRAHGWLGRFITQGCVHQFPNAPNVIRDA